jgi:Domain of unknown function (DUF4397)
VRRLVLLFAVAALALFGVMPTMASAGVPKTATLNVVHGIPALDVDVCVNGVKKITDFNPGEVVAGITLPVGRYDLAVVAKGAPCSPALLELKDVGLWDGHNYTVVANLDAQGAPNLKKFRNNVSKTEEGQARLLIRHTAAAPAVNVWADGTRLIKGSWFDWGSRARREVPAGDYAVKATLPGHSTAVIGPTMFSFDEGTVYQIYAWGSAKAGYAFAVVPTVVGTYPAPPVAHEFEGKLWGEVTFPADLTCPEGLRTHSEAMGKLFEPVYTHIAMVSDHCTPAVDQIKGGKMTLTAENGDMVYLEYWGVAPFPGPDTEVIVAELGFKVTGGTGAFEGATGKGHMKAYVEFPGFDVPVWDAMWVWHGTIVY